VCVGFISVLRVPSPKSHSEPKESPSASSERFEKLTASGAGPLLVLRRKSARGVAFCPSAAVRTFTMSVFGVDAAPRASVTTRLTRYSPGTA
jgi:hypothetical protein